MIYLIVDENKHFCKIGYADKPEERLNTIQIGNPFKLYIFSVIEGQETTEAYIHNKFAHLHKRGEWFMYMEEIYNYFKSCNGKMPIVAHTTFKEKSRAKKDYTDLFEKIKFPGSASEIDAQIMTLISRGETTAKKIRLNWEKEKKITSSREGKEVIYTRSNTVPANSIYGV